MESTINNNIFTELEESIDELFEQEIAYVRLHRMSLEFSKLGGVRE
jgi:hypothetical protein